MAATLSVVPDSSHAGRYGMVAVTCEGCNGRIHVDVPGKRLRRLVAALARVHQCPGC